MLALRWHGRNDIRLDDIPAPGSPSRGELLLDIEACGICGTDIEEWQHGPLSIPLDPHPLSKRSAPMTLGHEVIGIVAEAGNSTTIPVGARVAVEGKASCGRCWWCSHAQANLCPHSSAKGLSDDGGLAERMLAPESMCVRVPNHVDARTAVFCEPLAVVVRAVQRSQLESGQIILVIGGGTIGQLTAQVARAAGASVVLVEPLEARRRIAYEHGATLVVAPEDARAAVDEITHGRGADSCIETSGARNAVHSASEMTRNGGTIVLVGITTEPIGVSPFGLIWKEQAILGSRSHVLSDFGLAIELLSEGEVNVRGLLSTLVPLCDVVSGFHALRDRPADHLKIVVAPDAGNLR